MAIFNYNITLNNIIKENIYIYLEISIIKFLLLER